MNKYKELRKALGLNQQQVATALGIARSSWAVYETDKASPSNAVISLICRTYNVNEVWLREGTGEMFRSRSRQEDIAALVGELLSDHGNEFKRRFISVLARLSEAEWQKLEEKCRELMQEEEP